MNVKPVLKLIFLFCLCGFSTCAIPSDEKLQCPKSRHLYGVEEDLSFFKMAQLAHADYSTFTYNTHQLWKELTPHLFIGSFTNISISGIKSNSTTEMTALFYVDSFDQKENGTVNCRPLSPSSANSYLDSIAGETFKYNVVPQYGVKCEHANTRNMYMYLRNVSSASDIVVRGEVETLSITHPFILESPLGTYGSPIESMILPSIYIGDSPYELYGDFGHKKHIILNYTVADKLSIQTSRETMTIGSIKIEKMLVNEVAIGFPPDPALHECENLSKINGEFFIRNQVLSGMSPAISLRNPVLANLTIHVMTDAKKCSIASNMQVYLSHCVKEFVINEKSIPCVSNSMYYSGLSSDGSGLYRVNSWDAVRVEFTQGEVDRIMNSSININFDCVPTEKVAKHFADANSKIMDEPQYTADARTSVIPPLPEGFQNCPKIQEKDIHFKYDATFKVEPNSNSAGHTDPITFFQNTFLMLVVCLTTIH
eukprot:Nk52_evm15s2496 gene=Nk52_evmTU15s2496